MMRDDTGSSLATITHCSKRISLTSKRGSNFFKLWEKRIQSILKPKPRLSRQNAKTLYDIEEANMLFDLE